jgi:hypothetical protein
MQSRRRECDIKVDVFGRRALSYRCSPFRVEIAPDSRFVLCRFPLLPQHPHPRHSKRRVG